MRKKTIYKIYYNELTPVTETGNRATLKHDLLGAFESSGMAYLVLKLLKENAYKNLINADTATPNDRMVYLAVEH